MKTNRRSFLKHAAALAATAAALPSPTPAAERKSVLPRLKEFQDCFAGLPRQSGLRVQQIETFNQGSNLTLVRVKADDGSEGFGQVAPFDADITATVLHRKIAPLVLGADPYDGEAISLRCVESNYKFPWSFVCRALAGVDTALWDLRGRREKKSVCELLGGQPRPLPAYGSSMSRTIKPEDEAARLARLRDEKGFRAFKIRVGKVCGHDQDQWPGRTEALVPAVRKALGDRVGLHADGNSCYTPKKAIEVGKLLQDHRCDHFEEPCPYWELEWTAEVAAALEMPVAGGEQDNDLAQWRRMIRLKAVDIVQPDICYVGGLTRATQVALMGAEAGLPCVPHSANLSLVTIFTLHLFGALPNAGPFFEFTIEGDNWTGGLYEPALVVKDGNVSVPDGPGWGVRISPAWLERSVRQVSERKA